MRYRVYFSTYKQDGTTAYEAQGGITYVNHTGLTQEAILDLEENLKRIAEEQTGVSYQSVVIHNIVPLID